MKGVEEKLQGSTSEWDVRKAGGCDIYESRIAMPKAPIKVKVE